MRRVHVAILELVLIGTPFPYWYLRKEYPIRLAGGG